MPRQQRPSKEIRFTKRQCGVFDTTFTIGDAHRIDPDAELTQRQVNAVAKALEERFENWWTSRVEPQIQRIEKRGL